MLTYDGGDDIIDQYIFFCKVLDDQRRKNPGADLAAINETIRICMEKDVLTEYLKKRQEEVVSIMLTLFTQQEAHDMEIRAERKEAAEAQAKKTACKLKNKMPVEEIAELVEFPVPTVKFWLASGAGQSVGGR